MEQEEKNKDHIKEAIDYVFRDFKPKKERFIKLVSYCKGIDGAREYGTNMEGLCDHPECNQCRSFEKILKEEIDKQIKKFTDEN